MNNDQQQIKEEVKMLTTCHICDVNKKQDKFGWSAPAPPFSLNPSEFSSVSKLFRVTAYALRFIQCLFLLNAKQVR